MRLLHAPAPQREVEGEDEDQELVGFRVRLGPAEGLQHAAEQWTGTRCGDQKVNSGKQGVSSGGGAGRQ